MTPQSQFMVLAPVAPERATALRELLATMNSDPGVADPANALVPFGLFPQLHFARFAVLEDETLGDFEAYGVPRPNLPRYLVFVGTCDGPDDDVLLAMARQAAPGLHRIFSHCEGFNDRSTLVDWLRSHRVRLNVSYINWIGRTVRQIREDSALAHALAGRVDRSPLASPAEAQQRRRALIDFVDAEVSAGRLALTPPDPTPLDWQVAKLLHLIAVPLIGLLLLPLFLIASPVLLLILRRKEQSDPEICPRPNPVALRALQTLEDRDVTNQYIALGSRKPGAFRRWLETLVLVGANYACRHISTRGRLARIQTIHSATWAFIDDTQRLVFTSNYDGGHEAYMDDFINKVGWGLNLVFSSGVGWPRTRWLVGRGVRAEHKFKAYQRRHQLPTHVWYKAYRGLGLVDLDRNQRIRDGLLQEPVTDAEALAWLQLL